MTYIAVLYWPPKLGFADFGHVSLAIKNSNGDFCYFSLYQNTGNINFRENPIVTNENAPLYRDDILRVGFQCILLDQHIFKIDEIYNFIINRAELEGYTRYVVIGPSTLSH